MSETFWTREWARLKRNKAMGMTGKSWVRWTGKRQKKVKKVVKKQVPEEDKGPPARTEGPLRQNPMERVSRVRPERRPGVGFLWDEELLDRGGGHVAVPQGKGGDGKEDERVRVEVDKDSADLPAPENAGRSYRSRSIPATGREDYSWYRIRAA